MSTDASRKAVLVALATNLGVAASKLVGHLATGSFALAAEAAHSLVDTTNQLLLLLAARSSRKRATEDHPFGFGRERYLATFVVSALLFATGGIWSLWHAVSSWNSPADLDHIGWALALLAVAAVAEGASFLAAARLASGEREGKTWWAFLKRTRNPELPVVLAEDFAAVLGVMLAAAGLIGSWVTGDGRWDSAATAAIGVLLSVVAVFLAAEARDGLLGEGAETEDVDEWERLIVDGTTLKRCRDIKTLHVGPEQVLVAAVVEVPRSASAARVASAIVEAQRRLHAADDSVRWVYITPVTKHVRPQAPAAPRATAA